MPSQVITAHITAQTIAAERENAVVVPKLLMIDNQRGTNDCEITIQDSFTPSAYYGVAAPPAQIIERLKVQAVMGDVLTLNEADLKGVKCLGAMLVDSDNTDALCDITVGYEHE
ncbi:hypothetical protein LCGC14_1356280 [marine sediment metagenome]|uniref:Uncharacterized protein n=1 Tax=marine sediment metagenome TaxID=412755 RepID=A0A0F9NBS3_9ZZZZ